MRIGILGANGKIGMELALLLQERWPELGLTCFVRSSYSCVLFELAKIPCQVVDFERLPKALFQDYDLLVDLSYPRAQSFEIPKALQNMAESVMASMRPGAAYVHASSVSAFGMPTLRPKMDDYRIAWTSYARIKRDAESRVRATARKHRVDPFILRLGQTHGFFQAATAEYTHAFEFGTTSIVGGPQELTNTVFVGAILDAVLKCLRRELDPGNTYTLVSNPQWSLEDFVSTLMAISRVRPEIQYVSPPRVALRPLIASTVRDLLDAHLFLRWPALAVRAKGIYRVRAATAEAHREPRLAPPRPIVPVLGAAPGLLVPQLSSSAESAITSYRTVEARMGGLLEQSARSAAVDGHALSHG